MKKILLALILAPVYLFAFDNDRIVAKITNVTVFQNQAQITSTIKGIANTGNSIIIIENVSPNLNPQSIQIVGKGDLILMGSKYNNNFSGQNISPKMKLFTDSLKYINEDIRMISLNQEALEREKDLLKANYSTAATTMANTAEKVKAMADFFRIRMADINTNIIKNERLTNNLKDKLNKIQLQINNLSEQKNRPFGEIEVSINAKSRTNYELEITYIVNGAGWAPVYDIRVKDTKSPIALAYKANVWQQTGVDWNNVKLTLSTTNPMQGGQKPELFPQMLDIYQPQPSPVYKSRSMDSRVMADEVVAAPAMEMQEVVTTADMVAVTENTLAVNFEIGLPYTILNSGKPELVDIQNHSLTASFNHFGIPKYDTDAFLTANISGWEQYNLLPGKANVYFENAFIGETYIADNQVSDSLNLSLGRDKKINFKREIIRDYSSKKTIGANIRDSQAYRITIRNTKKETISLVIEDQIPVSKNSDIEVLEAEYKGAEINAETGKLTWKLNLKPSETKIIDVKYTVKYPKNKTIIGL